jgi:hypothetical protein
MKERSYNASQPGLLVHPIFGMQYLFYGYPKTEHLLGNPYVNSSKGDKIGIILDDGDFHSTHSHRLA